jgi:hypothetical protein
MRRAVSGRMLGVMRLAVAALVLSVVLAVVIWDPLAGVVRGLEVPGAPDVPWWLRFLVGKAKYILLAAIVLLVAARRRPASTKESP